VGEPRRRRSCRRGWHARSVPCAPRDARDRKARCTQTRASACGSRTPLASVGRYRNRRSGVCSRRVSRSDRRVAPRQHPGLTGARTSRLEPGRLPRGRDRVRVALRRRCLCRAAASRSDPHGQRAVAATSGRGAARRGTFLRRRMGSPVGSALRHARGAHPASRGGGSCRWGHRGDLCARARVRVPRELGEHFSRPAGGAFDPGDRVCTRCADYRHRGAGRRCGGRHPLARRRKRLALAAFDGCHTCGGGDRAPAAARAGRRAPAPSRISSDCCAAIEAGPRGSA
jgi:hypothetical protein